MSWLPGRTPSSAEATTPPGDYDEDNVENVERLRHQLSDIQRKLQKALGIRKGPPNKDAGHVDVDFVQTKPSKRGALVCKKKNVKIILHGFHVVSALVPAGEKMTRNRTMNTLFFLPPFTLITSHLLLTTGDRISPKDASRL